MHNEETISITDLIHLLLSKIWLIILVTVLGGAAAFCYSKFVLPLEYSSHISMYVQSYTGISENVNSVNNISNSKQLVNTYMEVMKDDAVMNAVAEELAASFRIDRLAACFSIQNGRITPSSLRKCLSISSVTDTSAVKVTATTKDAEVAAAICNDLTHVAPKYVEQAVGVGSINTIDTAKVYHTPVAPNTTKNTAIGLLAGFMLICLIIFLIDFFDNTIKNTDQLSDQFKKPILGEIQLFGDRKKSKKNDDSDSHSKLTDENIPFSVIESYKSIRTNIMFSLSTTNNRVFAVSSPDAGDGKSTTSANIAIALSQGDSKVLLIDADMRKAVQHKIFGLTNKKGLSTAISRQHSLSACIQKNVMKNLDVMTAGPIPPNPSELLASDQMTAILNELSSQYSVIVIDTPPVNIVTDTMELAKNLAGIIMVLQYAKTTREDVDEALKRIDFAQINLMGFILNGVKRKDGKYYSKYAYKKGYGYYYGTQDVESEPDDPEEPEKPELPEPTVQSAVKQQSIAIHADSAQLKQPKKGKKG